MARRRLSLTMYSKGKRPAPMNTSKYIGRGDLEIALRYRGRTVMGVGVPISHQPKSPLLHTDQTPRRSNNTE